MPQTLLALAALAIVSLFAFNRARAGLDAGRAANHTEAQAIATGAALGLLDRAAALPFDAALAGGPVSDPTALTPETDFGGATLATASDVDDIDGMAPVALSSAEGLRMSATARVRYVEPADLTTPAGGPTFAKRVEVTVAPEGGVEPVVLSRTVTYP